MVIKSQHIEILMAEKGLTQTALAQMCGIAAQNISAVLRRGTCAPPTAGKLASGLGVPVAEIVEGR